MKRILAAIALVVACQDSTAPYQPFARANWLTFPPDGELVTAIVGNGASRGERDEVAEAVRDVLVPELHRETHDDVGKLEWSLNDLRGTWDLRKPHSAQEFIRFVLEQRVHAIALDATLFAEVRLHAALWPNEPFPEEWNGERAPSVTHPDVAATELDRELDTLADRWRDAITTSRDYFLARDMTPVARTGDYATTAAQVYKVLAQRGIVTLPDAKTRGPWVRRRGTRV